MLARIRHLLAGVQRTHNGRYTHINKGLMWAPSHHNMNPKSQGAVAWTGRRLRQDEDPSSGLASLRTSELFLRIARVRRNEAPLPDESICSRRGHWRTAHV